MHLCGIYAAKCSTGFRFQIAAEVAAPLAKTDEIVLLGDDRTTSEVSRLLASMPPSVQALTGVDISKVDLFAHMTTYLPLNLPERMIILELY